MGKGRMWDPSSSERELETKSQILSRWCFTIRCASQRLKDSTYIQRVWWVVSDTVLSAGTPWVDTGTEGLFPCQKWEIVVSSSTRIVKADSSLC